MLLANLVIFNLGAIYTYTNLEEKPTFLHFISDKQLMGDVKQYLLSHKELIFILFILYNKKIEILINFTL